MIRCGNSSVQFRNYITQFHDLIATVRESTAETDVFIVAVYLISVTSIFIRLLKLYRVFQDAVLDDLSTTTQYTLF